MIVYGELLFVENFVVGCVLFYITGEIFKVKHMGIIGKLRFIIGGILCGIFSMIIFLPIKSQLVLLIELAFAFVVCFIVFGKEKIWQRVVVFILVTYFMGGIIMGILLATENTGIYTASGIYTGNMKAGWLALYIALGVFTTKQIIKVVSKEKFLKEHVFDVKISIAEVIFETKGFVDSGNQLTDPISGKSVVVAQASIWKKFQQSGVLLPEKLGIVPYKGISGGGIMISVRADYIEIEHKRMRGIVITNGIERFDLAGKATENCEVLLSKYMTGRKI